MDIGLILTAVGGMIAGFLAIAKLMLKQASADRNADRKERELLTSSIRQMAKASERVAVATTKSAKEAKERNGHLGEQNVQIATLVSKQNDDISSIKNSNDQIAETLKKSAIIAATDKADILAPHDQFVKEQTVVHQTVASNE